MSNKVFRQARKVIKANIDKVETQKIAAVRIRVPLLVRLKYFFDRASLAKYREETRDEAKKECQDIMRAVRKSVSHTLVRNA